MTTPSLYKDSYLEISPAIDSTICLSTQFGAD